MTCLPSRCTAAASGGADAKCRSWALFSGAASYLPGHILLQAGAPADRAEVQQFRSSAFWIRLSDSIGTADAVTVHAGLGVSGAVDAKGQLYMWGFGETCQLGRASEDDAVTPALVPAAGRLAGHKACTSPKVYGMLLPSPQLI